MRLCLEGVREEEEEEEGPGLGVVICCDDDGDSMRRDQRDREEGLGECREGGELSGVEISRTVDDGWFCG